MEVGYGRREKRTKARSSILRSVRERELSQRIALHPREANYELGKTRHTVGRRQSGRFGSCPACAEPGKSCEQHLHRAERRRSSGYSLLSRGVRAQIA